MSRSTRGSKQDWEAIKKGTRVEYKFGDGKFWPGVVQSRRYKNWSTVRFEDGKHLQVLTTEDNQGACWRLMRSSHDEEQEDEEEMVTEDLCIRASSQQRPRGAPATACGTREQTEAKTTMKRNSWFGSQKQGTKHINTNQQKSCKT